MKKQPIVFLIWMILPIVVLSCRTTTRDLAVIEHELISADMAFSDLSMKKGMPAAFSTYAHEEAVLLRPGYYPIEGYQNILKFLEKGGKETGELTWQPLKAVVATSGDLGYTYGVYRFRSDSSVSRGNYLSIWKKDTAGQWKYILDTGNPGLGE